jgi:hypothetical protein
MAMIGQPLLSEGTMQLVPLSLLILLPLLFLLLLLFCLNLLLQRRFRFFFSNPAAVVASWKG